MSFFGGLKKILNVGLMGLPSAAGHLIHGDVKGALTAGASGGLAGGYNPAQYNKPGMPSTPAAAPGAQNYLNSFAPAEQQRIQGTWAGNNNGLNDWFKNAQAAGVPGAQNNVSSSAPAGGGAIARPGGSPIDPAAWSQALHEAQARVRPGGGGGGWARPSQPLQAPVMGGPAAPGQPPAGGGQDLAQRMDFARRRFQMMGGGGGGGQVQ